MIKVLTLTNDIVSFEQLGPGLSLQKHIRCGYSFRSGLVNTTTYIFVRIMGNGYTSSGSNFQNCFYSLLEKGLL